MAIEITYHFFDLNYPKRFGPFLEEWKDIIGFEGLYCISNYGRCKSLERIVPRKNSSFKKKEKILSDHNNIDWYINFIFSINSKFFYQSAHVLVALHFIPNPENKPEVNHKNGIKGNSFVGNLEWVTPSENHLHAYQIGLQSSYQSRMVLDIYSGIYFDTIKQAAKAYNINRQSLNTRFLKNTQPSNLILA